MEKKLALLTAILALSTGLVFAQEMGSNPPADEPVMNEETVMNNEEMNNEEMANEEMNEEAAEPVFEPASTGGAMAQ